MSKNTMLLAPLNHYPVVIVEDRYSGSYSEGRWLAISKADLDVGDGRSRADAVIQGGPSGGDTEAMQFWAAPPSWIAAGDSPDAALRALVAKPSTGQE